MNAPQKPVIFDPSKNTRAFRTALSRYTTGVAIVTAMDENGPVGITVNSFSSLSLDPALIMWAVDKNSARHDTFARAHQFAVHVLSSHQKAVCDAFVRSIHGFDVATYDVNSNGLPIIRDCLAVFECVQFATHTAGDHTLLIGQVITAHEQKGDGLIFVNGAFGTSGHAEIKP